MQEWAGLCLRLKTVPNCSLLIDQSRSDFLQTSVKERNSHDASNVVMKSTATFTRGYRYKELNVCVGQFTSALHSENWKSCKFRSRSIEIDVLRHGLPIGRDRSYFSLIWAKSDNGSNFNAGFKSQNGTGPSMSSVEKDAKYSLAMDSDRSVLLQKPGK